MFQKVQKHLNVILPEYYKLEPEIFWKLLDDTLFQQVNTRNKYDGNVRDVVQDQVLHFAAKRYNILALMWPVLLCKCPEMS